MEVCQRIFWLQDYFFEVLIYLTYHEIKHVQFHSIWILAIIRLAYESNQVSYTLEPTIIVISFIRSFEGPVMRMHDRCRT